MKAELVCLLVLLTAVVQGKVLKKYQLKRDELLNALLQRRSLVRGPQTEQVLDSFVDVNGGSYDLNGGSSGRPNSISDIQELLFNLAMSLEPLKEEVDQGNGEDTEGLRYSIDSLGYEIQMLESELNSFPQQEVQTATTDLLFELQDLFGIDFLESVWTIYNNIPRDELPLTSEYYEETGNNVTQSSPAARLSQLTNEVRRISTMVSGAANEEIETALLLRSMTDAIYERSQETMSTTGTSEPTTPTTEAPTETPTTPAESQSTEGQSQQTEGQSQTTEDQSQTTEDQNQTTEDQNQTTTTPGNLVQQEQQLFRRRLTDLLLKKLLQRNTV